MNGPRIRDLTHFIGEKVTINGWLYNKRTAGKLQFPIVRDGSGYLQCVVPKNEVSEETWREFFYERDFVLIDSPILTPAACEGTSTLFETDYFGDKAYLSQSGQLYLEPAAAAFGRVYCFGPTFRAEKSKTRRHLTEFWMIEPEVAFLEFDGLQDLAEEFIEYVVGRALERCQEELKTLGR